MASTSNSQSSGLQSKCKGSYVEKLRGIFEPNASSSKIASKQRLETISSNFASKPLPQSSTISSNATSEALSHSSITSSNVAPEPLLQSSSTSSNEVSTEQLQSNRLLNGTPKFPCTQKWRTKITSEPLSQSNRSSSNAETEPLSKSNSISSNVVPESLSHTEKSSSNGVPVPLSQSNNMSSETLSLSRSISSYVTTEPRSQLNGISSKISTERHSYSNTRTHESGNNATSSALSPSCDSSLNVTSESVMQSECTSSWVKKIGRIFEPNASSSSMESNTFSSTLASEPFPQSSIISSNVSSDSLSRTDKSSSQEVPELLLQFKKFSNTSSEKLSPSSSISSTVTLEPLSLSSSSSSNVMPEPLSQITSNSSNVTSEPLSPPSSISSNVTAEELSLSSISYIMSPETLSQSSINLSNVNSGLRSQLSNVSSNVEQEPLSQLSSVSSNETSEPLPELNSLYSNFSSELLLHLNKVVSKETSHPLSQKMRDFSKVASEVLSQMNVSSNVAPVPLSQLNSVSSNMASEPLFSSSMSSHMASEPLSHASCISSNVAQGLKPSSNVTSEVLTPSNSISFDVEAEPQSQTSSNSLNLMDASAVAESKPLPQLERSLSSALLQSSSMSSAVTFKPQWLSHQRTLIMSKSHSQSQGSLNLESLNVVPLLPSFSGTMSSFEEEVSEVSPTSPARHSEPVNLLRSTHKQSVREKGSTLFSSCDGIEIRTLKMKQVYKYEESKVQKLSFGTKRKGYSTQTILLLGAVGSGKTTLINAIVNVLFDVQFDDDFRLKVPEENSNGSESTTEFVTAYVFHYTPGMVFNKTFVLIDTPGYGDVSDLTCDQETIEKINAFFMHDVTEELNNVSFVQALTAGPASTLVYVFDGLMSIFGKDIAEIISVMITNTDDVHDNQAVDKLLHEANVIYKEKYFFNNSYLLKRGDSEDAIINNRILWNQRRDDITKFLLDTWKTVAVSLQLTREVLIAKQSLNQDLTELLRYICPCHTRKVKHISGYMANVIIYLQRFILDNSNPIKQDITGKFEQRPTTNILGRYKTTCLCFHELGLLEGNSIIKANDTKEFENRILDLMTAVETQMKKLEEISFKIDPLLRNKYLDSLMKEETDAGKNTQICKGRAELILGIITFLNAKSSKTNKSLLELLQGQECPSPKPKNTFLRSILKRVSTMKFFPSLQVCPFEESC